MTMTRGFPVGALLDPVGPRRGGTAARWPRFTVLQRGTPTMFMSAEFCWWLGLLSRVARWPGTPAREMDKDIVIRRACAPVWPAPLSSQA